MFFQASRRFALGCLLLASGTASAQTDTGDRSGLWRLAAPSDFTQGCFDPCQCPLVFLDSLRGEFRLSLVTVGDVFDFYDVEAMSLLAPQLQWSFDGTGQFLFSQHLGQLSMNVTLRGPGETSSDFHAQATVPFNPDTMDLSLNINDLVCYDTLLHVVAARCRADWDRDGVLTPADVAGYVGDWVFSVSHGSLAADFDRNGIVQAADVASMVSAWFSQTAGAPCS